MLDWAANEFELSTIPQGSEITLRASLNQVSKQTRKPHEKLIISEKRPQALLYLWDIFLQLYKFGQVITYVEIVAWVQLMEHPLTPQEIQILKTLDALANAR